MPCFSLRDQKRIVIMKKIALNHRREIIKISVVVPVFNSEGIIGRTIEALLGQSLLPREIIIVDDGSTDNTAKIVKKYPVKYLYQKNAGPAAARNNGWKHAHGDIVAFTDSDCIPDKNWLKNLVEPFKELEVGAVGGAYKTANPEKFLARLIGMEIEYRYTRMGKYINAHGSYNLAVRKQVLEEVNGFCEDYPVPTAEDFDLCFKIVEKGYKIAFVKKAKVAGFHRESFKRYMKDQFRHGYYRMLLYRVHPQMMKGDSYSGAAKYQVFFSFVFIFCLLFSAITFWLMSRFSFYSFFFSVISLTFLFLINSKLFLNLVKRTNLVEAMTACLLQVARSIAWLLGAIKGAWRYQIKNKIL